MFLKTLLYNNFPLIIEEPVCNWDIKGIVSDSRQVDKDYLFFALNGLAVRGEDFVGQAIQKGARVVVLERDEFGISAGSDVCHIFVPDIKSFMQAVTVQFYDYPYNKLKTIGITGTNGKTTITYLLRSLAQAENKTCGVIGTIKYIVGNEEFEAKNTTPGLMDIYKYLSLMVNAGNQYCAMEVSSHALDQGRAEGIPFRYAIFTNLTSDHLDYHKTRENYFLAKAKLFTNLSSDAVAVINIDDEFGPRLVSISKGNVMTYGIKKDADIQAINLKMDVKGSSFTVKSPFGTFDLRTPLIGIHNIYNILSILAVALKEGFSISTIQKGLMDCVLVPGRLERINAGQPYEIFIDYAHTEDALANVLSSIRRVFSENSGKLIVVFGCGGDRDRTKRPKMAAVVEKFVDFAVVTSDNPRSEDPKKIIDEILVGFTKKNYCVIQDRKEAIRHTLNLAKAGDVVLLAGKGHETYQILKDKTIHFDEREVVREVLHGFNR